MAPPILVEECRIFQAFRQGKGTHVDTEVLWRADGTSFPAEYWSYPVHREGQVVGSVVTFLDIAQRKKAEQSLRESEERFRLMFASNPLPMWVYDVELLRFLEVNEAAARHYGYSRDEFLSLRITDLRPAGEVPRLLEYVAQPRPPLQDSGEWRHRTRPGQIIDVHVTSYRFEFAGRSAMLVVAQDITERKQAERRLRASEAKYRSLVEQAADAILMFSENMELEDVNSAACQMIGYSREELVGRHANEFVSPDSLARRPVDLEALRRGEVVTNERRLVRKDGTLLHLETSTKRLDDGHILTIGRDVTERKRSEEAIRRHTLTFETIHDAIYFTDAEGRVIDCNPAAERLSGYSHAEALGRSITFLHKPEEFPMLMAQIQRDLASTGRWSGEMNYVRKDGSQGVVETTIVVMLDEQGEPFAAISTSRDITERKRSEEALRASEEKFRAVFDTTLDPLFILDSEGHFVGANPAAARLAGVPQDQLSDLGYEDFEGRAGSVVLEQLWLKFLHEGQGRGEIAFVDLNGQPREVEYYGETNFIPGYHLAVVHDITERNKAEEARTAREAAEQANLAKSEFLSRMSHELRTPLNAILGFSQLLQMSDLTPKQAQSLGYILKAGDHLLTLINEVLEISRIESGRSGICLEPVAVREALKECLDLIGLLAAQRQVTIDTGDSLEHQWYVLADRQRLRQVLLNIMSNAVKYNRETGSVLIRCAELKEAAHLRIRITDTGPGLPQDKLAKLFTPFERLGAEQTAVEGTGLGLALSKRLMEAMNGTLGVESEVDSGSTFWVELPLVESPVEQLKHLRTGPLPVDPEIARGRTILYIEDNLSSLKLVETLLEETPGIQLLTAIQASLGLEIAQHQHPDLILLDLHLPDMQGGEVLQRLQADDRTRSIPVVVISADATQSQVERLMAAGARDYLTKPLSISRFLQVLRGVLNTTD